MSAVAVKWAEGVKGLTHSQWLVLKALAASANADGVCIKTQAKITKTVRLSERTVRETLAKLQAMGLIYRERRHGKNGQQAANAIWLGMVLSQPAIPAARPTGSSPKVGQPAILAPLVYNIYTREAGAPEKPQNPARDEVEFSPCANPSDLGDNIILLAGRAGR
jgi:DNA-binding transcriptional ArsR family regulator